MLNNLNVKIQENADISEELLNMKLINMYCKHMIKNDSDSNSKANRLLEASCKIGYEFCEWGAHEGRPSDFFHHLNNIMKMEQDGYKHAVRIVICRYKFCNEPVIWVDNLHSTIKYIREYGMNVRLKDIPFYIVDLTDVKRPIVKGYKNSLRSNISDVFGAISSAYYRYEMSNLKELVDANYTVNDLLNDNQGLYTYHNPNSDIFN